MLCIKEVDEGDDGVYIVIVCNELGEGENKEDLEVIGSKEVNFIYFINFKIKEYYKWLN